MFRVEWLQAALDELAAAWTPADSVLRRDITAAAQAIDRRLERDPFQDTESRDDEVHRICFQFPLAVTLEVDSRRRVVYVLHAWLVRKRS